MIIVADSDRDVRRGMARVLEEHGFEVLTAAVDENLPLRAGDAGVELVVAGFTLARDSREYTIVKEEVYPACRAGGIPLLCVVDTVIPPRSGVRPKETDELECDAYCDKPVDVVDFVAKVSLLTGRRGKRT